MSPQLRINVFSIKMFWYDNYLNNSYLSLIMKKRLSRFSELKKEVNNRMFLSISAAFAFVIALSWNEAIKSSVDYILSILSIETTTYLYKILAAVLVTIICVLGIMIANKRLEN